MEAALRVATQVLPGHRIEITAPELDVGEDVQVIVMADRAAGRLPREGRTGRPGPAAVVGELTGKVERVEGRTAHVTLVDGNGRETFARADADELLRQGIAEGGRFKCRITRHGTDVVTTLEPASARSLSDEEWDRLREETTAALADLDPANDY
jgi:hypothetical protein